MCRTAEKYLDLPDVENVGTNNQIVALNPPTNFGPPNPSVAFVNATVTWPGSEDDDSDSTSPLLGTRTPGGRTPGGRKFMMPDLSVEFPVGELSLICGPLGSGKTLTLLGRFQAFEKGHPKEDAF